MSDILQLTSRKESENREFQELVVQELELLLKRAKAGEIEAITFAVVSFAAANDPGDPYAYGVYKFAQANHHLIPCKTLTLRGLAENLSEYIKQKFNL